MSFWDNLLPLGVFGKTATCLPFKDEGFAAAGGLMRDQNGRWIIGFNRYLRNCIVTEAEFWGILDGLKLILDRIFER
ncbi:hypothetical protein Goklo_027645, partial [Gossypium klotzschianum]|nr:hypothetical protein [Gossypium klotzschianum]